MLGRKGPVRQITAQTRAIVVPLVPWHFSRPKKRASALVRPRDTDETGVSLECEKERPARALAAWKSRGYKCLPCAWVASVASWCSFKGALLLFGPLQPPVGLPAPAREAVFFRGRREVAFFPRQRRSPFPRTRAPQKGRRVGGAVGGTAEKGSAERAADAEGKRGRLREKRLDRGG